MYARSEFGRTDVGSLPGADRIGKEAAAAAAVSVDESGRRVFKLIPSGAVKKKRMVSTCRVGGDGDVASG